MTTRSRLTAVLAMAAIAGVGLATPSIAQGGDGAVHDRGSGHELPAGPLSTLDAINDRGVVAGMNTAEHAATWDPRTNQQRDLGLLPESSTSQALAVNNKGMVAGVSRAGSLDASYNAHAFRWTVRGGMVDLGTLGGRFSTAAAINNQGDVVGTSAVADGYSHAFLWTPRGGLLDLGTLPGMTDSVATDINDNDHVVGYSSAVVTDSTGQHMVSQAFQWTRRGGMTNLGTLGGDEVQAAAINDRGVVVGTSTMADGSRHVFKWTSRTGITDLGTMGEQITVRGLTNTGTITGFRQAGPTPGSFRAYRFTPSDGFQDLGLPASDEGTSFANAMNDKGRIVGALRDGDLNTPYRTFIWQPTGARG